MRMKSHGHYQKDEIDGEIKNKEKLEDLDAVVHLAGENIASKRWTDKQKQKIRDSRVEGTKFLVEQLLSLKIHLRLSFVLQLLVSMEIVLIHYLMNNQKALMIF